MIAKANIAAFCDKGTAANAVLFFDELASRMGVEGGTLRSRVHLHLVRTKKGCTRVVREALHGASPPAVAVAFLVGKLEQDAYAKPILKWLAEVPHVVVLSNAACRAVCEVAPDGANRLFVGEVATRDGEYSVLNGHPPESRFIGRMYFEGGELPFLLNESADLLAERLRDFLGLLPETGQMSASGGDRELGVFARRPRLSEPLDSRGAGLMRLAGASLRSNAGK